MRVVLNLKYSKKLIEEILSILLGHDALFNQVLRSSLISSLDLVGLLEVFAEPAQQQKLIAQVFAHEEIFTKCFNDSWSIKDIVQAVPHYGNEMLAQILLTPSVYTKIGVPALKKFFSNDEQRTLIDMKEKQLSTPQQFNPSLHNDKKPTKKRLDLAHSRLSTIQLLFFSSSRE